MTKYRTTKDITIPAGTEVTAEPPHKTERLTETASITTAVTDDVTSEWRMDLEEAIAEGVVEEIPEHAGDTMKTASFMVPPDAAACWFQGLRRVL